MTWQKRVAKEWIWFVCTFAGSIIFWLLYIIINTGFLKVFNEFWKYLGYTIINAITLMLVVYAIRTTVWAIKQLKRKEGE